MPQAETRRLAAIMFTDIVGFSRQMGSNEARMLRLLEVHNQLIQQAASEHHGTVIKTIGDAFLVDFPSVVNAVQCVQQLQRSNDRRALVCRCTQGRVEVERSTISSQRSAG